MGDWKFKDSKNLAVISTRKIFSQDSWIAYVSHDVEDNSWQFYGNEVEVDQDDLILVGLIEIVELDETVEQLADLPLGWHAWRDTKTSPWKRGKMPPELPEPTN